MIRNTKRRWFKIMAFCVEMTLDHHLKETMKKNIDIEELRVLYSWLLKRKASLLILKESTDIEEAEFDLGQLPVVDLPVKLVKEVS